MTLAIGIVGAGVHGQRYLRHAARDVAGVQPVAVCRRARGEGERLAEAFGCRWYANGEDLIADPAVTAVIIATPPASHFDLACATLRAGKPLLLEKPMTGTLAEARKLHDLAAAPGAPAVMVAQTLRWNPVLRRARALLPHLGRVHLIRLAQRLAPTTLSWQRDLQATVGGSVLLTGVHLFDLVRWLSGREFRWVASRQRRILNPVVEDLFLAQAELDDGCWVSLEVTKVTDSRAGWLEIVGEAGQLQADYVRGGLSVRCGREETHEAIDAAVPTLPSVLEDFRDVVRGTRTVPVTASDGLRTLEVVAACYASAAASGSSVAITDV